MGCPEHPVIIRGIRVNIVGECRNTDRIYAAFFSANLYQKLWILNFSKPFSHVAASL
jgi:hypothetical protein